jgi:hypothetical protein
VIRLTHTKCSSNFIIDIKFFMEMSNHKIAMDIKLLFTNFAKIQLKEQ